MKVLPWLSVIVGAAVLPVLVSQLTATTIRLPAVVLAVKACEIVPPAVSEPVEVRLYVSERRSVWPMPRSTYRSRPQS